MSYDDIYLTPVDLVSLAAEVHQRWPEGRLKKNAVGNLIVEVGGEWVAYVDFYEPAVVTFTTAGGEQP